MGCVFSRKTYIEEKIEECEGYLKIGTKNISKIKQAFFQLNDGEIIKEKALRRAIINLELNYENNIASFVVFPFFQSFAIGIENEQFEKEPKKKEVFMRLDEIMNKSIQSDVYDFNKIICILYLLSNENSSNKALEIFKHFCGPIQTKMRRNQIEDLIIFLFQTVAFYSLIFSELSSKKIVLLNSKIQESINNEKDALLEWLFADTGEDEISEEYFVNRIKQYEVYLGFNFLSSRGIRRKVMSFVYMKYEEMEDYLLKKSESESGNSGPSVIIEETKENEFEREEIIENRKTNQN